MDWEAIESQHGHGAIHGYRHDRGVDTVSAMHNRRSVQGPRQVQADHDGAGVLHRQGDVRRALRILLKDPPVRNPMFDRHARHILHRVVPVSSLTHNFRYPMEAGEKCGQPLIVGAQFMGIHSRFPSGSSGRS